MVGRVPLFIQQRTVDGIAIETSTKTTELALPVGFPARKPIITPRDTIIARTIPQFPFMTLRFTQELQDLGVNTPILARMCGKLNFLLQCT
jgi:hypothetical protein